MPAGGPPELAQKLGEANRLFAESMMAQGQPMMAQAQPMWQPMPEHQLVRLCLIGCVSRLEKGWGGWGKMGVGGATSLQGASA